MEMAQEFPSVYFRGFDIGKAELSHLHLWLTKQNTVPIQTRYPLPNVQFEIHDVNTNFRWGNGTFDLVSARAINMAVSSPSPRLALLHLTISIGS